MEYMYDGICIFVETLRCTRQEQYSKLLTYYILIQNRTTIDEKKSDSNISIQLTMFWDRESALEQRLYGEMKRWETRHPIMGIVTCTILGGILISLVAGIILEAIINSL